MQCGSFRPAIYGRDSNKDVLDVGFGVFNKKVEVTAFAENTGIEQLELRLAASAALALFKQSFIRKLGLRIFVEHTHVTVSGRRIKVKVILLHVFTMIALISGEAEEPLFQNGIASIP